MKQEQQASENRLNESVMQVSTHQNNMGMGMMDNIGLGMPIIISTSNQQMTSVPMDTSVSSVQTVQAVPGTSTQSTHDQISQNQSTNVAGHHEEDEDSSDDEENESDDDCDNDDGNIQKNLFFHFILLFYIVLYYFKQRLILILF